jgi:hypothetical protein
VTEQEIARQVAYAHDVDNRLGLTHALVSFSIEDVGLTTAPEIRIQRVGIVKNPNRDSYTIGECLKAINASLKRFEGASIYVEDLQVEHINEDVTVIHWVFGT